MNRIMYVEVFTTINVHDTITWIRVRRERNHQHETHKLDSIYRADMINKILKRGFTIDGATVGPWGIVSIVYYPTPKTTRESFR